MFDIKWIKGSLKKCKKGHRQDLLIFKVKLSDTFIGESAKESLTKKLFLTNLK